VCANKFQGRCNNTENWPPGCRVAEKAVIGLVRSRFGTPAVKITVAFYCISIMALVPEQVQFSSMCVCDVIIAAGGAGDANYCYCARPDTQRLQGGRESKLPHTNYLIFAPQY